MVVDFGFQPTIVTTSLVIVHLEHHAESEARVFSQWLEAETADGHCAPVAQGSARTGGLGRFSRKLLKRRLARLTLL